MAEKGLRRDGLPFRYGERGYNPDTPVIKFVFPGNPNNPDDWSLYSANVSFFQGISVGSIYLGEFAPEQAKKVDMAFTYHRWPGNNNIQNVDRLYIEVDQLQQMYDQGFNNYCNGVFTSQSHVTPMEKIEVFPVPASDFIQIRSYLKINRIEFFSLQGQLITLPIKTTEDNHHFKQIDLKFLPSGTYLLKIQTDKRLIVRKIIKL